MLVGTDYQRVEVYRRTADGWGLFRFCGPEEDVELTSIGVCLATAGLYRRTDVPETPAE